MGHYDEDYEHERELAEALKKKERAFLEASPTWKRWKAEADRIKRSKVGEFTVEELLEALKFLKTEPKHVSSEEFEKMMKSGIKSPKLPRL